MAQSPGNEEPFAAFHKSSLQIDSKVLSGLCQECLQEIRERLMCAYRMIRKMMQVEKKLETINCCCSASKTKIAFPRSFNSQTQRKHRERETHSLSWRKGRHFLCKECILFPTDTHLSFSSDFVNLLHPNASPSHAAADKFADQQKIKE